MTAASVFAVKELREIVRTWRIWVLPGIVVFLAVQGPLLARFTPQLVGALVGDQLQGLKVPPPTYADAYAQWIKNLSQIVLIAVIIVYGSLVSGETRGGTSVLVLTKPLSRAAFVLAKAGVHSLFLATVIGVGTLVTWLLTFAVFGQAPGAALWGATGEFFVFGLLFIALMTLFSVLIGSAAGAAGAGLAAYVALSVASIWKPLGGHSPAALVNQSSSLAAGKHVTALWPVLTGLLLAAAALALAVRQFRRLDL